MNVLACLCMCVYTCAQVSFLHFEKILISLVLLTTSLYPPPKVISFPIFQSH